MIPSWWILHDSRRETIKVWCGAAAPDQASSSWTRTIIHVQDIVLWPASALSHLRSLSIHHLLTFSASPWQLPRGTVAPILSPKAPDIHPVLSEPASYRFVSASPALIIHTAESHSPERWPDWPESGSPSPTLWSYLCQSITRYQPLIHKYSVHPEVNSST